MLHQLPGYPSKEWNVTVRDPVLRLSKEYEQIYLRHTASTYSPFSTVAELSLGLQDGYVLG